MFRRRRYRSSPSPEQQLAAEIERARLSRLSFATFAVDELPITQGLAQLHADVISTLDLYAVDSSGKRISNTPDVLEQPDPDEDREVTIHKLVQSLFWKGNGYSLVNFDRGAMSIKVQNPNQVAHIPDVEDDLAVTGWYVHGLPARLDQVNHWKLNDDPRHGPLGRSPLDQCWTALENYSWAYRYLADFYLQGGNPSLVIRSKTALQEGQAEEVARQWVQARMLRRPAVLDPQFELEQGPPAQDLEQTLKVLDMAAAEVCRLLNVPPSIANVITAGTMTYANVQDELRRWLVLSLGPTWLRRLEAGFTRLLAPGLKAKFDQDELTRFDVLDGRPAGDLTPQVAGAATRAPLRAVS